MSDGTMEGKFDVAVMIRDAISRFMALLSRSTGNADESHKQLAMSLDQLVSVYFHTDGVEPDGEVDAPSSRYAEFYQIAAKAFPELGLYPYADPGADLTDNEPMVADAIDDIGDIAGDLQNVLWHFENTTTKEAIWHFRWGYQYHWGVHLHSLRNYLHSTRIAAW